MKDILTNAYEAISQARAERRKMFFYRYCKICESITHHDWKDGEGYYCIACEERKRQPMNKFTCKALKENKRFHRGYCGTCDFTSQCVDYREYEQGHNDELREATNDTITEETA